MVWALGGALLLSVWGFAAYSWRRGQIRSEREAAEGRIVERIRDGHGEEVVLEHQATLGRQYAAARPQREALERERTGIEESKVKLREDVTHGRPIAWVASGAMVLGCIWLVAVVGQLRLDHDLFDALGHSHPLLSAAFWTVGLSFAGLLIGDLLGWTRLFPLLGELPRHARLALGAAVVFAFFVSLGQLWHLAEYRSANIRQELLTLEANRQALSEDPDPDPAAMAKVEGLIALQTEKLEAAKFGDRRAVVGFAFVEAMASWSVPIAASLVVLAAKARRERALQARVAAIDGQAATAAQAMYERLIRLMGQAGLRAPEMRRLLPAEDEALEGQLLTETGDLNALEQTQGDDPESASPTEGAAREDEPTPDDAGEDPPGGSAPIPAARPEGPPPVAPSSASQDAPRAGPWSAI